MIRSRSILLGSAIPKTLALALIMTTMVPHHGTAAGKRYMGIGVESCGSWLAHRQQGGSSDMQWALGYLSAAALWTDFDPLASTDGNGVWYWLDSYCSAHADQPFVNGLDAFIRQQP
jgi:hypothetical protein